MFENLVNVITSMGKTIDGPMILKEEESVDIIRVSESLF